MFRFLSRLFIALAALLALRLVFATARRMNRSAAGPGKGDARRPGDSGGRPAATKRPPRIDRAAAEDVPFVEVEPEPERVRRG